MEVVSAPSTDALAVSSPFSARAVNVSVLTPATARAAAVAVEKALFHNTAKKPAAPASSTPAASAAAASASDAPPPPAGDEMKSAAPAKPRHRARVYTRTGDKGTSSLYTGERRRKDDCVFAALGDVDELNSALALAAEYGRLQGLTELWDQIATIQSRLLDVGSAVATPPASASAAKLRRVRFDPTAVATLESWIDAMDEQLPALTLFILPSGGLAAAHLHLARSICRRAERAVISVAAEDEEERVAEQEGSAEGEEGYEERPPRIEASVSKYLNRLSDYLFTAARFAAQHAGREETVYKKAEPAH